jgi:hypothetical protein
LKLALDCRGAGLENPAQDLALIRQVFVTLGRQTEAESALQEARRLVMERAERIVEPELRASFLNNVAVNRTLLAPPM